MGNVSEEHKFQDEIRLNYEENRSLLIRRLNLTLDPNNAAQTVYELAKIGLKLSGPTVQDLTPDQELEALDITVKWYTEQGLVYPHPETLEKQKAFWKEQKTK